MTLEDIDQLNEETLKIKKVKATVFIDCKFCKAAVSERKIIFAASLSRLSVNFASKGHTQNGIFMDDAISFRRFILRTYCIRHQSQSEARPQCVAKPGLLFLLFIKLIFQA